MRIKITKDGPYVVTGGIPIREMVITPKGHHYEFAPGRELPQQETYMLCRCGCSKDAPFCDGMHQMEGFHGKEVASRKPYMERITDVTEGSTMRLMDDGRCAFARFCHTDRGDIWTVTMRDYDDKNKAAAIKAAAECPAGRLVAMGKDGSLLEEKCDPEIIIMQDPEKGASAGIFVKGPVVIEGADGEEYEVRNRVALCRCGKSRNKPFCDAAHVPDQFDDGFLRG